MKIVLVKLLLLLLTSAYGFVTVTSVPRRSSRQQLFFSPKDGDGDEKNDALLDELAWRSAKIRLEEANTQRLIKRKPIKLPYLEARRWVQANLGAETKEEFYDLVANGNLRTPYIPKSPKTYYTETGEWISWEHFLTGFFEEKASGLTPPTGKFD